MTAENETIVCKFGGTSMADVSAIRQVARVVESDPRRRAVVVSAPGKRNKQDHKITDLLYLCHQTLAQGLDAAAVFAPIRERYESIGRGLGVEGVGGWLDEIENEMKRGHVTADWMASRGEYLSARILAAFLAPLGARFVDAADCVRFNAEGRLDDTTYELTGAVLEGPGLVVVPGFYGQDVEGRIKTFSRGGSDVTGAVVARALNAAAYENWTDVDGLLMADPRLVENPLPMREVTYQELRELSYMGATVLHDEAVFPVREAGIPIHIRCTQAPDLPGTWIRAGRPNSDLAIVGIAGRKGFSAIQIEKALMNAELGFGRRVLQALETHGISFEHAPSGIDSFSVVLRTDALEGRRQAVLDEIRALVRPDRLEILDGLALIATVGQGMSHRVGVAGRVFGALAESGVNLRMIDQGASEINIIVGVVEAEFETAVRAIYRAFVPG